MKRAVVFLGLALLVAASMNAPGFAQVGPPPGPGLTHGFFLFMRGGRGWAKTVIGSPFSAQAVTEMKRTLADGNVIDRKQTESIYRDSNGRVRIERTLKMIGPWMSSGAPPEIVTIHDPVAGVSYFLNPTKKTAYEMQMRPIGNRPNQGERSRGQSRFKVTTQSLGVETVNGVECQGTQRTTVIPAGTIGNAQPITIVSEQWYSPDLQMNVMTTRNDPRFGVTTYQLTNIQTTEPSPSLFQVPSDYTVEQGFPHPRREGGAGNY